MKTITAFVVRAIDLCVQYAWPVIAAAILLTVVSSWYAATHFAMTTDVNQLISPNIPWRQREAALEKAFPQFETIVAVIDAPTPELVDEATDALVARLSQQKALFHSIEQLKGGSFFAQNGFLFETTSDLAPQLKALTQAQRLIQVLAGDPSLRGVIQALQFGLLGVQGGQLTLDNMTWPMTLASNTLDKVNAGQPASFSWHELVQGRASTPDELLRFLQIRASLDYSELEPGQARHRCDPAGGQRPRFRIQISGPPSPDRPGADGGRGIRHHQRECGAQRHRDHRGRARHLVAGAALGAHHFRGVRLPCGRTFHHRRAGLLMVGTLNLISVYFAVLFVGLGVDFGLQFSVRYRAERHEVDNLREALLQAGRRAGAPLTLAALATAAGFLSFLPTVYKGVSELGLIAGVGMLIAFATSITLLPALLSVLKPPSEPAQLGYKALAPVDRFLARHRMPILIITLAVVAAGLPLLFWLRFDFNPINLRSPKTEAVATYLALKSDPETGANDIQVLEPSLTVADQVAAKLRALPQVARVTTLSNFIPSDQQQKLPLIQDAAKTLDPVLNPTASTPPPTDAQNVSMMGSTIDFLNRLAGTGTGSGAVAARRLATALSALAKADPPVRQRAETVFVQPLHTALDDLRDLFKAHEVTLR